jgi:hypothetical protein
MTARRVSQDSSIFLMSASRHETWRTDCPAIRVVDSGLELLQIPRFHPNCASKASLAAPCTYSSPGVSLLSEGRSWV